MRNKSQAYKRTDLGIIYNNAVLVTNIYELLI